MSKPKPAPTLKNLQTENHKLRKTLRDLTDTISSFLARLDVVMEEQSREKRDRRIAALANALDMANDSAIRFGLGESFEKIDRAKEQLAKLAEREERS